MPWTMTLVFSSTKMAISGALSGKFDRRAGGFQHGRLGHEPIGLVALQDLAALDGVGAVEADHDRCLDLHATECGDDAVGHVLALGDAAEDVDEDGLDV